MVSLNRPDLVLQCLTSVEAHTCAITYEVHLVAHAFEPDAIRVLRDRWPQMVVHEVSGIRGYSENNNVALRAAKGRYVAILNDDTVVESDVFGGLVEFLDQHQEVAAACPVLRNVDGTVQLGVRGRHTPLAFVTGQLKIDRLLPRRWVDAVGLVDRAWAPSPEEGPVDLLAGTGACFVARREAIEAIGYLDEAYFLGPDDIDWSFRLRREVGRIVLLPSLSITHLRGTTLSARYHAVLAAEYAGTYTLLRRHFGRGWEWAVRVSMGFLWSGLLAPAWCLIWLISGSARARMMMRARLACVRFAWSRRTSSDVFRRLEKARAGSRAVLAL